MVPFTAIATKKITAAKSPNADVVVASAHSPWARRRKLQLEELLNEKWILYPPEEARGALVDQAFRDGGLAVPRARTATMSYHLRDMLPMTGEYLTVIPACMLHVLNAKQPTVKRLPNRS